MATLPSMFEAFRGVCPEQVSVFRMSKAGLTDLSHTLENLVLELDVPGAVFTGFQESRHWVRELARYERLVQPQARSVAVFAAGNLPEHSTISSFTLGPDSPLRQEWFLVVLTPRFCAALFGRDNPGDREPVVEEMDRQFDAVWTFEPGPVSALVQVLRDTAREYAPARAGEIETALEAFPPAAAEPGIRELFSQRLFESLEAARRRWRARLVAEVGLREELDKARLELADAERLAALGTLAASVAHELNNPLAAIAMRGTLLADSLVEDELQSYAEAVRDTALRAGRMIRDLLAYVRTGRPVLTDFPLAPLLAEVAAEERREQQLVVEVEIGASLVVRADRDRLHAVLANLLANARQASPPGATVRLEVRSSEAGLLELRVRDRGAGIPPELLERIFDPFVTTKPQGKGTGLGLLLARRFTEEHGGTLVVEATGPGGTTMLAQLPVLLGGAGDDAIRWALVVDDDDAVRAALAALLSRRGWRVVSAGSPGEARRFAADRPFDAYLVDLALRPGNGHDLIDQLELLTPGAASRCIIMTGNIDADAMDGPGRGELPPPLILKPFAWSEVEQALEQISHRPTRSPS